MALPERFEEHIYHTRFASIPYMKRKLRNIYIIVVALLTLAGIIGYGAMVFKFCMAHTFRVTPFTDTFFHPSADLKHLLAMIICGWIATVILLSVRMYCKYEDFKAAFKRQLTIEQIERIEILSIRYQKFSELVVSRIRKNGIFSDLDYKVISADHYYERLMAENYEVPKQGHME